MKYKKFIELDRDIDYLYEQDRYEEALKLLKEGLKILPENEIEKNSFAVLWDEIIINARCNKYDECFEAIKKGINQGYCFPLHFELFKQLQQKSGYKDLSDKNNKMIKKIQASTKVDYVVCLPEDYNPEKKYPLFLALHGDGMSNIQEFSQYWKPNVFLKNNFIFAYIQSSQVLCHNGYGWLNDIEIARRDIKESYDLITMKYSIDESSILIGGFSGGAIASIDFTLSNIIPLKGMIALCPEIKPKAFTRENVELAVQRGVKGVFIEGELVLPMKSEEEMIKVFDEVGFSYEYYINKGIGHSAPDDFNDKLSKALKFILD